MSIIPLPDCPECDADMDVDFGDVTRTDDGVIHHFTCPDCGHDADWTGEELVEMGITRPSLSEFVEYFDVTAADVRRNLGADRLNEFLRTQADTELDDIPDDESLPETIRRLDLSNRDVTRYFDADALTAFMRSGDEDDE